MNKEPYNEKKLSELVIVRDNAQYWERTRMLFNEYAKWSKTTINPDHLSHNELISFGKYLVDNKRMTVKSKTWMNYRFCVLYCLKNDDFFDIVNVRSTVSNKEITARTSAKRSNVFSTEMLTRFHKKTLNSNSAYKQISFNWIQSTVLTGIRPKEWITATIEYLFNGEAFIKVNTIEKGVHLANWQPIRYLPIFHLDNHEQDIIRAHLNTIKIYANNDAYDKLYSSCRMLIQKYTTILFGDEESVSLYSCRQQFAANLKASGISTECIMLVMGHSSEETQRHHYASRHHGELISFPEKAALKANNLKG